MWPLTCLLILSISFFYGLIYYIWLFCKITILKAWSIVQLTHWKDKGYQLTHFLVNIKAMSYFYQPTSAHESALLIRAFIALNMACFNISRGTITDYLILFVNSKFTDLTNFLRPNQDSMSLLILAEVAPKNKF